MHDETFLHKTEPITVHARHRRRRFLRSIFTVLGVFFVGWLVLLALAAGQLAAAGLDLRERLVEAQAHAQQKQFDGARQQLQQASVSLIELERSLYFLRMLWIFPGLDRDLEDLQGAFISSRLLLNSLDSFFKLGQDVIQLAGTTQQNLTGIQTFVSPEATFRDLPTATKRSILQRLSTASDDFDLLSARIEIAKMEFERIRSNRLVSPFLGVLEPYFDHMDTIHGELEVASTLAHLLPELSGLDAERTHLLLFLNNDELRPGGGFIGTYGLLKTKDGEISSLSTKDVYAIDNIAASNITTVPPEPLKKYNETDVWFFRDANWNPDFAESARQAITMFEQESAFVGEESDVPASTQIDGVIGFTPTVASALLEYLGPIQVGGQTFTAQNVPELIEYQVEQGFQENGIPFAQRKEILSELVVQIQDRLVMLPFSNWADIFSLLAHAIKAKQLAVYSENESVEKSLIVSGWSGSIYQTAPDMQLFVDANLASLKTDPVVQRSISYALFRNESGQWVGRTTVVYDHKGSFDWRTTRYRTYARLFVPEGTSLIRTSGFAEGPIISQENDKTSFGGFLVVEPGQQQTLVFEYRLADTVIESIAKQSYRLQFFKQMGARDYPLTLELDFDKNVLNAVPAESRNEWGDDQYRVNTKLSQDLMFEVGL